MARKPVERPAPHIIPPPRPNMPTYYEWPSESEPGRVHRVMVYNGVVKGCTCRGAKHGCWHQKEANMYAVHQYEALIEENEMSEETSTAVAVSKPQLPSHEVVIQRPREMSMDMEKYDLMWKIAQTVHKGGRGMLPDNITTPEAAMAVMMAGLELGFQPMTSLRLVFIVNGRVGLMAEGLTTVVKDRDPSADFEWHEMSPTGAEATLHRTGQRPLRIRYDESDRKRSGQGSKGGPWVGYPVDMYRWAVLKRLVKFGAPELVNLTPHMAGLDEESVFVEAPRSELTKAIAAGEVSAAAASDATEPPEMDNDPDVPPTDAQEAAETPEGEWGDIDPADLPDVTPEATATQGEPIWAQWAPPQLNEQHHKLHERLMRLKGSLAPSDYGRMARGIAKDVFGDEKHSITIEDFDAEQTYNAINATVLADGGDVSLYWGA